jgi:hypothetical protein
MRSDAMLAKFISNPRTRTSSISRTPEKAAIELKAGTNKQLFEITWAEAAIEDYVWTKPANEDKRKRTSQRPINASRSRTTGVRRVAGCRCSGTA